MSSSHAHSHGRKDAAHHGIPVITIDGPTASGKGTVAARVAQRLGFHYLDSGVRSGQDVIRSVAMGARGVFIGRPFLYGLVSMGEAGVTKALEVIRNEADLTMAFCGLRNIKDVNKSILVPGTYPT